MPPQTGACPSFTVNPGSATDDNTKKGAVFKNVYRLKNERNPEGKLYFVNDHLPEELNERRRRVNQIFAKSKKNPNLGNNMTITKGKLFINGEQYVKKSIP